MSYNVTPAELFDDLKREQLAHQESRERIAELEWELDIVFQMLEVYGVPRQRAKSAPNGVDVLATRFNKQVTELERELTEARKWHLAECRGNVRMQAELDAANANTTEIIKAGMLREARLEQQVKVLRSMIFSIGADIAKSECSCAANSIHPCERCELVEKFMKHKQALKTLDQKDE